MPDDAIDNVARARIDGHEKVCADRYGEIKDSFGRVHNRLDKIMWGIISLLLAILGYVATSGKMPWVE